MPVVDEQAGEADRLAQRSAAVPTKVENHRFDPLAAEVVENHLHVVRRALEAGTAAVLGVGVAVETGQIDHADAVGTAVGPLAEVEDLAFRLAVAQCHLRAGDLVDLLSRGVGRHYLQPHDRVRLAADHIDDVVELHIDHVDDFTLLVLADADDFVLDFQAAVFGGRSAGNDPLDRDVAVVAHQRSPDPLQFQAHLHLKVLVRARRHVVGVRIERHGEGVQIDLQQFFAVGLVHAFGEAVVAAVQLVAGFLPLLFLFLLIGRLQQQDVVLDSLPPAIGGLGGRARILRRLAVGHHLLVAGKIQRPGQQLVHRLHPLVDPLQERAKHFVGETQVPPFDRFVEAVLVFPELVDIRLVEIDLHRIERFQQVAQTGAGKSRCAMEDGRRCGQADALASPTV